MGLLDLFRTKPVSVPAASRRTGPRFAVDRDRMFDLTQTARLQALFRTPRDQRGGAWTELFYDAVWNASLVVAPAHFNGPDGLPYFRLDVPHPDASFASQSLANLALTCVKRGAGMAIFSSPDDSDDAAQFVMSMGLLDSLLRFDSPDGDPIDRAESVHSHDVAKFSRDVVGRRHDELIVTVEHEVLIGTPSRDFLPPYTARALARYMSADWGIEDPRVGLLVDHALKPSRNLVIGRRRADFSDDGNFDDCLARLFWFLPRYRSIILMPDDWKLSDMARLADLGAAEA